jgi:hypothetical protein
MTQGRVIWLVGRRSSMPYAIYRTWHNGQSGSRCLEATLLLTQGLRRFSGLLGTKSIQGSYPDVGRYDRNREWFSPAPSLAFLLWGFDNALLQRAVVRRFALSEREPTARNRGIGLAAARNAYRKVRKNAGLHCGFSIQREG